jgi:hypothetical protein
MHQYDEIDTAEQLAETAQLLAALTAVLAELRAHTVWDGEPPANSNAPVAG